MDIDNSSLISRIYKKINKKTYIKFIMLFLFIFLIYSIFLSAPLKSEDTIIHISKNQSLSFVSKELKDKNVIKYPFVLKLASSVLKSDSKIDVGDYLFTKNSSVLRIAWNLVFGIHNVKQIKVTLKEGFTNEEMANTLSTKLSYFDKDLFLDLAKSKQGYLFPDTYFFFPLTTTNEVFDSLVNNFSLRIKKLNSEINLSGKSLSEIIIMASIIEKEANGKDDTQLISGILWHRIRLGMPLQVDAAPITYKTKGLSSSPICNPGLVSISAAVNPIDSSYLYYLHDKSGIVHFANTFTEHKKNIAKYLK